MSGSAEVRTEIRTASAAPRCERLLCVYCAGGHIEHRPHLYVGTRLIGSGRWRGGGSIAEFEELWQCLTCGAIRRYGTVVERFPRGR